MAQLLLEPEITGPFRNGALAAILYGLAAISLILGAFLLALHERSLRSFRSLRSLAAEEADMLDETSAGIVSSDDPEVPAASEGAAARDDDPDRELRGSVPWLRSALAFAVTALAFVLFGSNRFNFLKNSHFSLVPDNLIFLCNSSHLRQLVNITGCLNNWFEYSKRNHHKQK